MTALMVAAAAGHAPVVKVLLRAGADVGAAHRFAGTTALHMAAETSQPAAVTALCEGGAPTDARTSSGGAPLHTAADANASAATFAALLGAPCDSDAEALLNGDTTALYLAAQARRVAGRRPLRAWLCSSRLVRA